MWPWTKKTGEPTPKQPDIVLNLTERSDDERMSVYSAAIAAIVLKNFGGSIVISHATLASVDGSATMVRAKPDGLHITVRAAGQPAPPEEDPTNGGH